MSVRKQIEKQYKREVKKMSNEKNHKLEEIGSMTDSERKKMYNSIKKGEKKIDDPVEKAIIDANKLWDDLKKRIVDDPEFMELSDTKKVEVYQNTEFKEFYITYPIVCRYMICMGQFSTKAFRRFLVKSVNMSKKPVSKEKGYNEDQWIRRQSDYVRYLWESYQKSHFNKEDSNKIWEHSYNTLKKEFSDFREMHKEVEEKLKREKKENKIELVRELIERVKAQEGDDDTIKKELIEKLKKLKNP
jgi:uncharacterized protein Yka (UPF0111/DUF47 family)